MSRKRVDSKSLLQMNIEPLRLGLEAFYFNVATNIYKWEDVPDEIPIRYPEKWLYENGICTFFNHPMFGYLCLPVAVESIQKNAYGEPSAWRATAIGEPATYINNVYLNDKNAVLIRNDGDYTPCRPYVSTLIDQLVNVEITMRMNINAQKMPIIVKCNDDNVLQGKQTFYDYYEGQPVMFKDVSSMDTELEIMNPGIPFLASELNDTYQCYDNRIKAYLGVDYLPVEKQERLLTGEVDVTNQEICMIRRSRLRQREIAVKKINELFGLDMSVIETEDMEHKVLESNPINKDDDEVGNDV